MGRPGGPTAGDAAHLDSPGGPVEAAVAPEDAARAAAAAAEAEAEAAERAADGQQRELEVEVVAETERRVRSERQQPRDRVLPARYRVGRLCHAGECSRSRGTTRTK